MVFDTNFKQTYDKQQYQKVLELVGSEKDMHESDIRAILNNHMLKQGFLTIAERSINYNHENPFDLVCGGKYMYLYGFEIKGDKDNFNRLNKQLQVYTNLFDKTYIVLHKKEKPEWLPEQVGILRIFENGDIYEEQACYFRDAFDIGSDWEWDVLLKSNGLGTSSSKLKDIIGLLKGIRRNLIFNRFFAEYNEYKEKTAKKFYPLSDKEKELLIGFDVPFYFKNIEKEIEAVEKKIKIIKKIATINEEEK